MFLFISIGIICTLQNTSINVNRLNHILRIELQNLIKNICQYLSNQKSNSWKMY